MTTNRQLMLPLSGLSLLDACNSLTARDDLPVSLSWAIAKLTKRATAAAQTYDTARRALIEKYGRRDEAGALIEQEMLPNGRPVQTIDNKRFIIDGDSQVALPDTVQTIRGVDMGGNEAVFASEFNALLDQPADLDLDGIGPIDITALGTVCIPPATLGALDFLFKDEA